MKNQSCSMAKVVFINSILCVVAAVLGACASIPVGDDGPADANPAEGSSKGSPLTTDVAEIGYHEFMNSPELSESERSALLKIHTDTLRQSTQIKAEIARLKGQLFSMLVQHKKSQAEKDQMETIKRELVILNQKKMEIMFEALEKARVVFLKEPEKLKKIFKPFLMQKDDVLLRQQ